MASRTLLRSIVTGVVAGLVAGYCQISRSNEPEASSGQASLALKLENACFYGGEEGPESVYTFNSDEAARGVIGEIVQAIGLRASNFRLRAGGVPNAAAIIKDSVRLILYDQAFMQRVARETKTDWASASIMAHEVAHHLEGHTLRKGGSRPESELEADFWSGFALYNLGATMSEAQAAMRAFGSAYATTTHPAKRDRLSAIASGWTEACQRDRKRFGSSASLSCGNNPDTRRSSPATAQNLLPPSESPNMHPIAACQFYREPGLTYRVMAGGMILGALDDGTVIKIRQRYSDPSGRFAWIHGSGDRTVAHGIDRTGRIWLLDPPGTGAAVKQIGQCWSVNSGEGVEY